MKFLITELQLDAQEVRPSPKELPVTVMNQPLIGGMVRSEDGYRLYGVTSLLTVEERNELITLLKKIALRVETDLSKQVD